MPKNYRHTKIIVTLGPATNSPEVLSELITRGVDCIRLNMAHASDEWVKNAVASIRETSRKVQREVAVMMDIKGPEIRTGVLEPSQQLTKGQIIEFDTKYAENRPDDVLKVDVNYPAFPSDVEIGTTILVDSGLLRMEVTEKGDAWVRCKVLTPGELGSRRHINLPGVYVDLPSLTEKDEQDIKTGIEAGVDFFALSFVREANDVVLLRDYLKQHDCHASIISKIEDQAGLRNLDTIIKASDAIMVARGDLGIEVDYHKLPLVQTEAVEACLREGKPVIIATHLLESMVNSPMPTRAEISDVSTAIRELADCVMLSGETTTGLYPLECVDVLQNIMKTIEPSIKTPISDRISLRTPKSKLLRSAAVLAQQLGECGILVFTRSGFLPHVMAALRAHGVPIYAFTDNRAIFHKLMLVWGVEPFMVDFNDEEPEQTIRESFNQLKSRGWSQPGDHIVVITNALAGKEIVDTIQMRQID